MRQVASVFITEYLLPRLGNRIFPPKGVADSTKGLYSRAKANAAGAPQGDTHLLVIAIDKYVHCPPLHNCVKDARDLAQLLQEHYQVLPQHTYELYNEQATRKRVLRELKELRHKVGENDSLIVHFSGHGAVEDGEGYWIPVEGAPDEDEGWIAASSIKGRLNPINSFHTLVIADACFAGSFFISYKSANTQLLQSRRSRLGISASHSRERALDGEAGDNSPFAKELLRALRYNQQPLPVDELFTQVRDAVTAATQGRQTPIFKNIDVKGDDQGQFVFVPVGDEEAAWKTAKAADTIPAYYDYNQEYPDGKYRAEALIAIRRLEEEAHWKRTQRADTLTAYLAFLDRFPDGVYAERARSRQEAMLEGYSMKEKTSSAVEKAPTKKEKPFEPQPSPTEKRSKQGPPSKAKRPSVIKELEASMAFIPGGTFWMGWKDEARDGDDIDRAKPCHKVSLSTFFLGKYPVTQVQWEAVMGDNPSLFKACPNCPVERVSWDDIQVFIEKLNTMTVGQYRLPTEAEWEFAARGGKSGAQDNYSYSGSNTLDQVGWYRGSSMRDKSHPVGQKQPNQLGLYDMSGNVWEWCADCWHEDYKGAPGDGSAWLDSNGGDCSRRVLRGGSWNFNTRLTRVANRDRDSSDIRDYSYGFRLARD